MKGLPYVSFSCVYNPHSTYLTAHQIPTTLATMHELTSLPAELLDLITAKLDFNDIRYLRLSCNLLAQACERRFATYLEHISVTLTDVTTADFLAFTTQSTLRHHIRHLAIIGICDSDESTATNEWSAATMLAERSLRLAFECLAREKDSLDSLSIEVNIRTKDGYQELPGMLPEMSKSLKPVWQTAARTAHVVMMALAESGLQLKTLHIFSNATTCSLACDKIESFLTTFTNSSVAPALQDLNIRLSSSLVNAERNHLNDIDDSDEDSEEEESLARCEQLREQRAVHHQKRLDMAASQEAATLHASKRGIMDMVRLLKSCPNLTSLNLHWYKLNSNISEHCAIEEKRFFDFVVSELPWPKLRHCKLSGMSMSQDTLLCVVQADHLLSLNLENVYLHSSGTFRPIFDHLTRMNTTLTYLHLDDLWDIKLLRFLAPGRPKFPHSGGIIGPNSITRTGKDAQKEIIYGYATGRAFGSPQLHNWRRQRRLEFGPPRSW